MSDISKGKLFVLATAIASGIAVFYNAYAVKNADPLVFTTLKNILTAIMLVAIAAFVGSWKEFIQLKASQWMRLLAIAIVGGSIPFALFFWGLAQTDPSSGSFIYRLLFFASAAMAAWALKEKPSRNTLLAVVALLVANVLLLPSGFKFGIQEAAVLAATILWGAESVISKQALREISPHAVATARLGLGSGILLLGLALTGQAGSLIPMMTGALAPAALISALLLLIYVATWYRGLALLPVSEAAAILSMGGIITALLNLAFLGNAPSLAQSASLLLVAAAGALLLGFSPLIEAARTMRRWLSPQAVVVKEKSN